MLPKLTLFVLPALKRDSTYSMKAGLQYFVLSAVSLGFFLFGCVLLSVIMRETNIQVTNSVMSEDVSQSLSVFLYYLSYLLHHNHMWGPDVYNGPLKTTMALLATVPKSLNVFFFSTNQASN